ncbi:hypothetical protein [Paenibacillus chitinolyticus]|uniref:hypothetical protein n=1 Tax=Paenibacillus chitinolyticus TaxID=79263 RepID=UPI00366E6857
MSEKKSYDPPGYLLGIPNSKTRKNRSSKFYVAQRRHANDENDIPRYNAPYEINGGDTMDDGTKMMLERLERDSREREERYHNDSKERESRYHDEAKEREERITKLVEGLRTDIKAEFKTFSSQLDKMETKVDNTYKHISAITISTIVGIAACVIAVVGVLIAAFTLLPS